MGSGQSCNRNGSTDSVSSSAPIPRAPRGPQAHRGQREGADCLDDSHPRARGDGRAHTHTRPLPPTQSVTRGGRGGVETLSRGSLLQPRGQQPPAGRGYPEPRSYLGRARSEQLQVWPLLNQLLHAANAGFKTKGRGITLALFLPPGRNPAHDSGYTARFQRQPGSSHAPSVPLPTRAPGPRLPTGRGTRQGRGKTPGVAKPRSAVLDREGDRG